MKAFVLLINTLLALWLLTSPLSASEESLKLKYDSKPLDVSGSVPLALRLQIPERTDEVAVTILDSQHRQVRKLTTKANKSSRSITVHWDGKNDTGEHVPNDAYGIEATAFTNGQQIASLKIAESINSKPVPLKGGLDSRGQFTTVLAEPVRLQVRIGISGGPLLRTLVDWRAVPKGKFVLPWDGFDQSSINYIAGSSNLKTLILAKPLNEQLILTYGNPSTQKPGKTTLALSPIDNNDDGILSIKVGSAVDATLQSGNLFELVFYIDNQFVSEEERGYLPLNWNWDPTGIAAGRHTLTVNLIGFNGDIRVGSMILDLPESRVP